MNYLVTMSTSIPWMFAVHDAGKRTSMDLKWDRSLVARYSNAEVSFRIVW